MTALDRAIIAAATLERELEQIYQTRERGLRALVSPARMKQLELSIERCSQHEVFADVEGFRKGYRL